MDMYDSLHTSALSKVKHNRDMVSFVGHVSDLVSSGLLFRGSAERLLRSAYTDLEERQGGHMLPPADTSQ